MRLPTANVLGAGSAALTFCAGLATRIGMLPAIALTAALHVAIVLSTMNGTKP